jgi:hypothetical protein
MWATIHGRSVGALAHFLKKRFYRRGALPGQDHSGEHASIIDRPTFEAVQAKLEDNVRARLVHVQSSPAILRQPHDAQPLQQGRRS